MVRKKSEKVEEKQPEIKTEENKKQSKDDLAFLKEKVEKLKTHLGKNKHDYKTKRTLLIKRAKVIKLENYRAR